MRTILASERKRSEANFKEIPDFYTEVVIISSSSFSCSEQCFKANSEFLTANNPID